MRNLFFAIVIAACLGCSGLVLAQHSTPTQILLYDYTHNHSLIIAAPTLNSDATFTLPDPSAINGNFIMTNSTGGQTIGGGLTVNNSLSLGTQLTVGNGGTGRNSLTQYNVLLGTGTSAVSFVAPSASGQVLMDNGGSANPSFQSYVGGVYGGQVNVLASSQTSVLCPTGEHVGGTTALGGVVITRSGTLKNFYVLTNSAPTGVETVAFTILQGGSATSVTATVSGASVSSSDVLHSVSVSAGDMIQVKVVTSSALGASCTNGSWGFEFDVP